MMSNKWCWLTSSDVNKAWTLKAKAWTRKAKAWTLKAKAKAATTEIAILTRIFAFEAISAPKNAYFSRE